MNVPTYNWAQNVCTYSQLRHIVKYFLMSLKRVSPNSGHFCGLIVFVKEFRDYVYGIFKFVITEAHFYDSLSLSITLSLSLSPFLCVHTYIVYFILFYFTLISYPLSLSPPFSFYFSSSFFSSLPPLPPLPLVGQYMAVWRLSRGQCH